MTIASQPTLNEGMFLCAGLSTRMHPLTLELPKALVPFLEKTTLEWMMRFFDRQDIARIAINTHHGAEHIDRFLEQHEFNQEIHTFFEPEILGTGGAIKNMQGFVTQDHFFIINSDVFTESVLQEMFAYHVKKKALATLLTVPDPHGQYTKIYADAKTDQISDILTKTPEHTYKGMFGGITIMSKEIFRHMPLEKTFCLIRGLLNPLCQKQFPIHAFTKNVRWYDTGEIALFQNASKAISHNRLDWMK